MYDQVMDCKQGYVYGGSQQDFYYQAQNGYSMGYQYQPDHTGYFNGSSANYQNYQSVQQSSPMFPVVQSNNTLDYQMTPALYVLNQQAKILEKSLLPGMIDQPANQVKRRKQRGPYKKKNSKSSSPAPIESFENASDALQQDPTIGAMKRSNTSWDDETQMYQVTKQLKTSEEGAVQSMPKMKQSIFRCVDLLAQSSVNRQC